MLCLWEEGRNVQVYSEEVLESFPSDKTIDPSEEIQFLKCTIKIYQGTFIPRSDSGLLDSLKRRFSVDTVEHLNLYVQVFFEGLNGTTSKRKRASACCWNEGITFVTKFPMSSQPIMVKVISDELVTNVVGTAVIHLDKISNSGSAGFLPTFGPCYVHLRDSKDLNTNEGGISYRGRLLMSISSEIIMNPNSSKPYVVVDSEMPLPEGTVGKEADFLVFACLRDVSMIDNVVAEKKNIRLTLQFGDVINEHPTSSKLCCTDFCVINSDNSSDSNNKESVQNCNQAEYCSVNMTPVKTNKKYSHLPIKENKPCLYLKSSWIDCRRRMYISNIFEKMSQKIKHNVNKLCEHLEMKSAIQEYIVKNVFKNLEDCTLCFSEFLKDNWNMFSARTQLDIERWKVYEDILDRLQHMTAENTKTLDRSSMGIILRKMETILQDIKRLAEDPQPTLPEVVVWMEINQKRVGYVKIAACDILYSMLDEEKGCLSGKISAMFFRHVSKRRSGTDLAKVDIYLWLGLLNQAEQCLKCMPQGFESNFNGQELGGKYFVPRTLNYFEKQAYDLRTHIYQARSLPKSELPSFVAQILIGNRFQCTQIKENTLNPIWDQTLVFNNLLFYGNKDEMMNNPPEIVIEIYNLMLNGKSCCICRGVITVSQETQHLPLLKWYDIATTESGEPSQILAAFEFEVTSGGDGDIFDSWDDITFECGPVMQIPTSIRPRSSPHRIEILFWGLRDMKRVDWKTIEAPRLELECAGNIIQSSVIPNYRKHSNFIKMIEIIDIDLPDREVYLPAITIRLQDCKSFGRRNVLATHVLHSLKKYVVKAEGELLEPQFDMTVRNGTNQNTQVIGINNEVSKEFLFNNIFKFQNEKIPWTYSKRYTRNNGVEEGEEEDWWSRYYITTGEMPKEIKSEVTLTTKASKTGRRKTHAQLAIGDGRPKAVENLDARAFVFYPCELENVSEFGGFEEWLHSFKLTRNSRLNRLTRNEKDKTVADFKGCFRIYKLPLPFQVVDPFLPVGADPKEGLFHAVPENKPTKVLVRVYIVNAIDLAPSDVTNTTDAYITMQIGNHRFANKDNYIPKQLNPVFGKCFEFVACFPHESLLRIQIMDWDLMGSDDLIGETEIDLENRFYSRCRPICGLPRIYETSGPNAWRDVVTPLEILTTMCQRTGLGIPHITGNRIRIANIVHNFEISEDGKENQQDMALYLLHCWERISPGKYPLVPEHLETRTLYHPSKRGESQGKLVMWIDMFQENTIPPNSPREISARKPIGYELRIIIWNTDEVVLSDDAFFTGEKMSDIYVKGWITGKEDSQCTDVHYRSLTGEGNFNWRFAFPFDYLPIEQKIVVTRKVSVFSWDETVFKVPPELNLQVWDADHLKSDDYLGGLILRINHFPRGAKSSEQCRLELLGNEVPHISLFKQRTIRGWWPVSTETQDGGRELTGKIEAELHLLTTDEAANFPVGLGRKEPNALAEPKRPATSFVNFLHPLKTFRYAIWKRYRRRIVIGLIFTSLALLMFLFVYAAPGYIVKKILGA